MQGSDGSGVLTGAFTRHAFLKSKSFKATVLRKYWVSVTLSMAFGHRKKTVVFGGGNLMEMYTLLNLSLGWWLARFLDLCSAWN